MRNNKLRLAVLTALSCGNAVAGDIVFDGTLGTPGAAPFNAQTRTFSISQARGLRAGDNLFHSFGTFNLSADETASFPIETFRPFNTLVRVTGIGSANGLQPSTINGRLSAPNTNLWFMNPAGVIIGNGASLDTSGFAVGAADSIELGSASAGQQVSRWTVSDNAAATRLLTASPTAFGFLPGSAATLRIEGTSPTQRLSLSTVGASQPPLMILAGGGGVTLSNADLRTTNFAAFGRSTNSITSNGAIALNNSSFTTGGELINNNVRIQGASVALNSSTVGTTGALTGSVAITATGNSPPTPTGAPGTPVLRIDGSSTVTTDGGRSQVVVGEPSGEAGSIELRADSGPIQINGTVSSVARRTARLSGEVAITGADVILDGATIRTTNEAENTQTASSIRIASTRAATISNTSISATTTGPEDAGSIDISAQSVTLSGARTLVNTETTGLGNAGSIRIAASGASGPAGQAALSITDGATLRSSATRSSVQSGATPQTNAGSIALQAYAGTVRIVGTEGADTILTRASTGAGRAGEISVSGANVDISNATLNTTVFSNVAQFANEQSGSIAVTASRGVTLANTFMNTATSGTIAAGSISVDGESVAMSGGQLSASTASSGDAGDVTVTARGVSGSDGREALWIDRSFLGSAATIPDGTVRGNAGAITLSAAAGAIAVSDTRLSTIVNRDAGTAGSITLSANGDVSISGTSNGATITSNTRSQVAAAPATITLTSANGTVRLSNAFFVGTTSGVNAAANVNISGQSVEVVNSGITTTTNYSLGQIESNDGNAGNIVITANGQGARAGILLDRSTLTSQASRLTEQTGASAQSNAGSITLNGGAGAVRILGDVTTGMPSLLDTAASANAGRAGEIRISGGSVELSRASIGTQVNTQRPQFSNLSSGQIEISSPGAISMRDSSLNASTAGTAAAGDINVMGGSVLLTGGPNGRISAATIGSGNAGAINITATGLSGPAGREAVRIDSGMSVSSTATDLGSAIARGNAGRINVNATAGSAVLIDSSLQTSAGSSAGQAGSIAINAQQNLTLQGTSVQTTVATANSSTQSTAAAVALQSNNGAVTLTNSELNATTTGGIRAGNITVSGPSVAVQGGQITSSTSGSAAAGNVRLDALAGDLIVNGGAAIRSDALQGVSRTASAGSIALASAGATRITNGTLSTSAGAAAGQGGSISINAQQDLSLQDAALSTTVATNGAGLTPQQIAALQPAAIDLRSANGVVRLASTSLDAATTGVAEAGDVSILGRSVELLAGTTITTSTSSAGKGGDIGVAGNTVLIDRGSLSSQATAAGNAGGICVAAGGSGCVSRTSGNGPRITAVQPAAGGISLQDARLSTSTSGTGTAGNITLLGSGGLRLSGSTLQSSSTAATNGGAGGSIALTSGLSDVFVVENSRIDTNAVSAAGGDITIDAGGSPLAFQNSVILASAGAAGNGGDITINNAGDVVLAGSGILAQADRGNGGAITINIIDGGVFLQDSASLVSADSQEGINGAVNINAPNTDLNAALTPQEVDVSQPAQLSSNACAPSGANARSTFVREGRGGVAETPDGYLISRNEGIDNTTTAERERDRPAELLAAVPRASSNETAAVARGDKGCF